MYENVQYLGTVKYYDFQMYFITRMKYATDDEAAHVYLMMLRDGGVPTA